MDLTFEEKSAWGSMAGIVLAGLWYFPKAFAVVRTSNNALALIGVSVGWVVLLLIVEVVYHKFIASVSPHDVGVTDERDRTISLKAERNAGFALGFCLFTLVGWIVAQSVLQAYPVPQPLEIVVLILLAITASEVAKLASQIWQYRVGS